MVPNRACYKMSSHVLDNKNETNSTLIAPKNLSDWIFDL